jgi:carboxylesterase type B
MFCSRIALCAAVLLLMPTNASSEFVELKVESGTLIGRTVKNETKPVHSFLGVPFAAPPVNELRWQPPAKLAPFGIREALTLEHSCVQSKNAFSDFTKISEDCLYLNAWLPVFNDSSTKYPVMIFFYGGSWDTGSAMFPLYDGERLCSQGNTIVIAANYRLNAFGYLGSDTLRGTDKSTGNFGTLDQRAAMKWVHNNAAALHADVSSVMIFGESAGAGSVSNHMVHPLSFPYFTRAAMESGPFADWVAQNLSVATNRFNVLAEHAGCNKTNSSSTDIVKCLRALNTSEVSAAAHGLPSIGLCDWSPVIDGVELTAHPTALVAEGKFNKGVPVLLGSNADEGSEFVSGLSYDGNETAFRAWAVETFTQSSKGPIAAGAIDKLLAQVRRLRE